MTVDSLDDWLDEYETAVPNVVDDSGPENVSNWINDRVTSKLDTPGLLGPTSGTGFLFAFDASKLQTELETLIGGSLGLGVNEIANAWEEAVLSSTPTVEVLTSIGLASNATTWSAISSTVIDAASIAIGKLKILELIFSSDVEVKRESDFPVKMREAFLLLTVTTTGTDSSPGPSGPFALVDPARAVA